MKVDPKRGGVVPARTGHGIHLVRGLLFKDGHPFLVRGTFAKIGQ